MRSVGESHCEQVGHGVLGDGDPDEAPIEAVKPLAHHGLDELGMPPGPATADWLGVMDFELLALNMTISQPPSLF
jgi:hypothetical protein